MKHKSNYVTIYPSTFIFLITRQHSHGSESISSLSEGCDPCISLLLKLKCYLICNNFLYLIFIFIALLFYCLSMDVFIIGSFYSFVFANLAI